MKNLAPRPKPLIRLVFLGMLSLLARSQNFSHGTAIAVYRTNTEIPVASDSRVVDGDAKVLEDTCKIRRAGRLYFSVNAMPSAGKVNIFEVIERIIKNGHGGLEDKCESVSAVLIPLLSSAIGSNAALRDHVIGQGFVLGVTIFGYENGIRLSSMRFIYLNGVVSRSNYNQCPGIDCPQDGRVTVLVPAKDSQRFRGDLSPIDAVRSFVQGQIDRKDIAIDPPIQILRITGSGKSEWIEKPAVCKDQK